LSLVLDSSVALAWLFRDEQSDTVLAIFDRVVKSGAVVPSLWRLEVANGLQMAVRRGRINSAFRDSSLKDLNELDIATDSETDVHAWKESVNLADQFQLTLYDASYLELAQRRALPLASRDHALHRAASLLGLAVLGQERPQ
jgi:predicted nucleic acid-binding protein